MKTSGVYRESKRVNRQIWQGDFYRTISQFDISVAWGLSGQYQWFLRKKVFILTIRMEGWVPRWNVKDRRGRRR